MNESQSLPTSLTLEEARSVMWLRNHHRPLGELLDEGYLDESRLAWAAEKAYNPRLKEAAGVLLAWLQEQKATESRSQELPALSIQTSTEPAIHAGITLEEARTTIWPFRPFKGQPMGKLIDARQLGLRDLGYAIENAWNERVRRANDRALKPQAGGASTSRWTFKRRIRWQKLL